MEAALRKRLSPNAKRAEAALRKAAAAKGPEAVEKFREHRVWYTMKVKKDPIVAFRDEEAELEQAIMRKASIGRCIADLSRRFTIRFAACPDTDRFARAVGMGSGAVVVAVLRAFEQRRTQSVEAAYASVYAWMRSRDASLGMPITGNMTVAQVFREGTDTEARGHRKRAVRLVNEATDVLGVWVTEWNRQETPWGISKGVT